jgi:homoserine O-acetyltransferase
MKWLCAAVCAVSVLATVAARAADYPAPKQGDWIAKEFKSHTGEVMPELRLHYTTVGEATGEMLRRIMLDTIRNDPDYKDGNYKSQPRMMKYAIVAFGIASAGGTLAYQALAPSAAAADEMVDERLAAPVAADANDFIYQWEASHDYNPPAGLEKIEATVLAINAADDERNPPQTGVTAAAMRRLTHGASI